MGRQPDTTNGPVWVLVEPGVLVRYGVDGIPDRLHLVGPVTSDRLRGIGLQALAWINPHDTTLPTWPGEQPPMAEDTDLVTLFTFTHQSEAAEIIAQRIAGREYASADDFYRELAAVVTEVSPVDGSLSQAIAEGLGVTPNTASQYLHRCRRRGYLPPSRKASQ